MSSMQALLATTRLPASQSRTVSVMLEERGEVREVETETRLDYTADCSLTLPPHLSSSPT